MPAFLSARLPGPFPARGLSSRHGFSLHQWWEVQFAYPVRITPDVEKANATIVNGFGRLLQDTMEKLHPETAFFFADGGRRTANFICDLTDQSDIPSIAEPFFTELNAKVEFFPCMNVEDLKRGLDKVANAKEYAGA